MIAPFLLSLAVLSALLAATLASFRPLVSRSAVAMVGWRFWLMLGLALAGSVWLLVLRAGSGPGLEEGGWLPASLHWDSSLSTALWWSIALCLGLFAFLAAFGETVRRLAPLLLPYLLLLALVALASGGLPGHVPTPDGAGLWLPLHIAVSLTTYALATLAAVAGLAVFLRERALKRKESGGLAALLPAIADGERLQFRLLGAAEAVLGIGLATGLALTWVERGRLIDLDHKTLLSVLAFLLFGLLLLLHAKGGLRGRRAARLALVAYLLLTLSFIGVKFVTDVIIAA